MTRKSITIATIMFLALPSIIVAECLTYEPDTVLLSGKMIRETFPGAPNYESITDGDKPETYWILISDIPFCVHMKTNNLTYSFETEIEQVQLVFTGDEYQKHKNLVGHKVIAHGQLFPMQTGHHHTRVLMTVKELQGDVK